jgi:hypothetical protein
LPDGRKKNGDQNHAGAACEPLMAAASRHLKAIFLSVSRKPTLRSSTRLGRRNLYLPCMPLPQQHWPARQFDTLVIHASSI